MAQSYWQTDQGTRPTNVGEYERMISLFGGPSLALLGLSRRSLGGLALAAAGGFMLYRGLTGQCSVYRALGVSTAQSQDQGGPLQVEQSIQINRPAAQIYEFWRNFTNLPSVMDHLRRVELLADRRSRWTADGPRGTTVQWEAEIVDDVPGERIAWRTIGGPFESSGSVRFLPAPGGRGTEVVVDMHYQLEGGMAGKLVAMVSARDPGLELARGLRILKQRFELGEPMRSDASIHRGMHPGQPPKPGEKSRLDDQNTPEGAAR